MKFRITLALAASAAFALAIAGCGGEDSGFGSDPSALAPAQALIFAEGNLRPTGDLKADVDAIATKVAGVDNLGDLIVDELESSAREDGEPFDFEKDVEPWLGERAGYFFQSIEDGDPADGGGILQSTDNEAASSFIEKAARLSDGPVRDASYEGVDYKVDESDESVLGLVGDHVVIGEGERAFKAAVDASEGESLADTDRYAEAVATVSQGSLIDVYVDVGALFKQSEEGIDDQAEQALGAAGIDPSDATAVASVLPGEDRVEIEISSDLGGEEAPEGDASELLGSLPADSFVALAVSGFGDQLQEALDSLDESGIPGQVPPGQLKKSLKESDIDIDQIAGSLGDASVFATGSSEKALGGALVLTTEDANQASNTVSNIGLLLRSAGAPGVTALSGRANGFSIRSEDLGPKPLVVVASGDRIGIGYGVAPAVEGVEARKAQTLGDSATYRDAVAALGDTPISGFVDGRAALRLADALVPASDEGYRRARSYLAKVRSIAIGSERRGDLATARLIVSLVE